MSKNNLHVLFDDDDILLAAIKKIKEKKYHINEVYTPFPVHGLDKALGLKPTRISILAFIYGCIGFFFVLFLLYARSFPVIAQAEVKSILKSSGENYKKIRDSHE